MENEGSSRAPAPELPPETTTAPQGPTQPPRRHGRGFLAGLAALEVLATVILALCLAVLLRGFVAQAYEIKGSSMEPTFSEGQKVMVHKLAPALTAVGRGDVVIFDSPLEAGKELIKRVIGVGGDSVEIRRGRVYVNGEMLDEGYVIPEPPDTGERIQVLVPRDHFFVMGDNRIQSRDSREFRRTIHGNGVLSGCIPVESIRGKVFLRWWPLEQIKLFTGPP